MCTEVVQFINRDSLHTKKKTHHPHIISFDHNSQLSIGRCLLLGHIQFLLRQLLIADELKPPGILSQMRREIL